MCIRCIKPCPHCRRKVRLAVVSSFSATVALFCDNVCGHGFRGPAAGYSSRSACSSCSARRNEAESQQSWSCRGTIPLADANVQEHGLRSFVVSCNRRSYYLRASSTADRDRWVRSLRLAISQSRTTKPCSKQKRFSYSSSLLSSTSVALALRINI